MEGYIVLSTACAAAAVGTIWGAKWLFRWWHKRRPQLALKRHKVAAGRLTQSGASDVAAFWLALVVTNPGKDVLTIGRIRLTKYRTRLSRLTGSAEWTEEPDINHGDDIDYVEVDSSAGPAGIFLGNDTRWVEAAQLGYLICDLFTPTGQRICRRRLRLAAD